MDTVTFLKDTWSNTTQTYLNQTLWHRQHDKHTTTLAVPIYESLNI